MPWPVSTITGTSGAVACMRRTSSRPSWPGILRSVSTTSTGRARQVRQRLGHRGRRLRLVAARAEHVEQRLAHVRLVLHHQHAGAGALARRPWSGRLQGGQAHAEHRAAALAARTPTARRRGRARSSGRPRARGRSSPWSSRRARRCAAGRRRGCPGPRSATSATTSALSRRARTSTRPPRGLRLAGVEDQVDGHLAEHDRVAQRRAGARWAGPRRSPRRGTPAATGRSAPSRPARAPGPPACAAPRTGSACASTWRTMPAARSSPSRTETQPALGGGRVAARQRVPGQGQVVGHALERVVDLVGDAGGQAARRWRAAPRGRAGAPARARAPPRAPAPRGARAGASARSPASPSSTASAMAARLSATVVR